MKQIIGFIKAYYHEVNKPVLVFCTLFIAGLIYFNYQHHLEYRLIKQILLYEGSAVLWGANVNTPTLSVGKSLTKEEQKIEFLELIEQVNNLAKLLRAGKLSDGTLELAEIDLAQKTEKLKELYEINAIQPVEKTFDPVGSTVLLDGLKLFNNSY